MPLPSVFYLLYILLYTKNMSSMRITTAIPTVVKNFLESLLSNTSLRFLLLVDMIIYLKLVKV